MSEEPQKTELETKLESEPKSDSSEVTTTYDQTGSVTGTRVHERIEREVMTPYGLLPLQLVVYRLLIPAAMSFFVLFLCAYKIIVVTDPQELRAVYWSTITSVLASWMPSPGTRLLDDSGVGTKK